MEENKEVENKADRRCMEQRGGRKDGDMWHAVCCTLACHTQRGVPGVGEDLALLTSVERLSSGRSQPWKALSSSLQYYYFEVGQGGDGIKKIKEKRGVSRASALDESISQSINQSIKQAE
ncbi:hypothetical protein TEQG_08286 [Trichophyton equinum CBS 127.97]|uniref:Uncharacterized protein n=1 Tax=Trichophyton equinum (strain ATCC MYA-4606 / CBS 127.97) TaxID=559882 RepID=F2Q5C0_TRIEC|nr:hypothetical protein TEQG_08286 [Trichophyton equinum CBS 127.97]